MNTVNTATVHRRQAPKRTPPSDAPALRREAKGTIYSRRRRVSEKKIVSKGRA